MNNILFSSPAFVPNKELWHHSSKHRHVHAMLLTPAASQQKHVGIVRHGPWIWHFGLFHLQPVYVCFINAHRLHCHSFQSPFRLGYSPGWRHICDSKDVSNVELVLIYANEAHEGDAGKDAHVLHNKHFQRTFSSVLLQFGQLQRSGKKWKVMIHHTKVPT